MQLFIIHIIKAFRNISNLLSVSTFLLQDGTKSTPDEYDVKPDGPIVYIPAVHSYTFRIIYITSAAALPHSGDSRKDGVIFTNILFILRHFFEDDRPWSHEAHFAFEDVHELGEFVQACFSEEFSALCDAGVVFQFEFAVPFFFGFGVGGQEVFQDFLGVGYHGAEFVTVKFFAVPAYSAVFVDDRSRGIVVNPEGYGEEDGRNTDASHYGEGDIEDALNQLIGFQGQIIFQAEDHDFFIKEGGYFRIAHGDSDEVWNDVQCFHKALGSVNHICQLVLGETGGSDEYFLYSCLFHYFFQVIKSAENEDFSHIFRSGMVTVFEESDGLVGKGRGVSHFMNGSVCRFSGTYDEDRYLEEPGMAEDFPQERFLDDEEEKGKDGKSAHKESRNAACHVGEENQNDGKAGAPGAGEEKFRKDLGKFHISCVKFSCIDKGDVGKGNGSKFVEGIKVIGAPHEPVPDEKGCHDRQGKGDVVAGHQNQRGKQPRPGRPPGIRMKICSV